jgi:DNA-binding protein H-NS
MRMERACLSEKDTNMKLPDYGRQEMGKSRFNLTSMSVDALLKLRDEIGSLLSKKAGELKRELQRLEADALDRSDRKKVLRIQARAHAKIAPKYRGPDGKTWAGRGLRPKWLQSLIKEGHKLEEFAVDKTAPSLKKSSVKKSRRKRKAAPTHRTARKS